MRSSAFTLRRTGTRLVNVQSWLTGVLSPLFGLQTLFLKPLTKVKTRLIVTTKAAYLVFPWANYPKEKLLSLQEAVIYMHTFILVSMPAQVRFNMKLAYNIAYRL